MLVLKSLSFQKTLVHLQCLRTTLWAYVAYEYSEFTTGANSIREPCSTNVIAKSLS